MLEKPAHEITLEKVLDEEDLLQEIKVHNARLLDYLRQKSVLSRLLDLIVEDYKEDEKKGFKYVCSHGRETAMFRLLATHTV